MTNQRSSALTASFVQSSRLASSIRSMAVSMLSLRVGFSSGTGSGDSSSRNVVGGNALELISPRSPTLFIDWSLRSFESRFSTTAGARSLTFSAFWPLLRASGSGPCRSLLVTDTCGFDERFSAVSTDAAFVELGAAGLDIDCLEPVELDAADFDNAELDAAELDAAELCADELDAAELDAAELDATDLDKDELDKDKLPVGVPSKPWLLLTFCQVMPEADRIFAALRRSTESFRSARSSMSWRLPASTPSRSKQFCISVSQMLS